MPSMFFSGGSTVHDSHHRLSSVTDSPVSQVSGAEESSRGERDVDKLVSQEPPNIPKQTCCSKGLSHYGEFHKFNTSTWTN